MKRFVLKDHPHIAQYYRGQRKVHGSKGGQMTRSQLIDHLHHHGLPSDDTKQYAGFYLDYMHRAEHGLDTSESQYSQQASDTVRSIHERHSARSQELYRKPDYGKEE